MLECAMLKRILKNSAGILGARMVDLLAGMGTVAIVTRALGPERYGVFTWIWTFLLFFQPLINFETDKLIIRNIATRSQGWAEDIGTMLHVRLLLFGAATVAILSLTPWLGLGRAERLGLLLGLLSEFFYQHGFVFTAIFHGNERMELDMLLTSVTKAAHVLLAGGALLAGADLPLFFGAALLANLVRFVAGWGLLGRLNLSFRPVFSLDAIRRLMVEAAPVTLAAFLTHTALKADIFFLGWLSTPTEIALFHLPHLLALQCQMLPLAVGGALFPVFSRLWREDRRAFRQRVGLTATGFALAGSVLAGGIGAVGQPLLRLVAGEAFTQAAPALVVVALSLPFLFVNFLLSNALIVMGRQRLIPWTSAVTLALNASLDFALIPRLGHLGAAWATLAAYSGGAALLVAFFERASRSPLPAKGAGESG